MIDTNWTIGHTEPLAVFIYRRSYLIASYKNMNHVDFAKYYQIYYALLFQSVFFIMIVIFQVFCFALILSIKAHDTCHFFFLINIISMATYIQGVSGGIVNILEGGNMEYS
jgi:hypothetical protein